MANTENKEIFSPLFLAILIVIVGVLLYCLYLPKPKYVEVDFFDVGQGDAALIKTPSGQSILIDGGPNDLVSSKLDKAIPFYNRKIDAIILSHPHADHLAGLIKVLETYQVGRVYFSGVSYTTPEYLEFLDTIKRRNILATSVKAGDSLGLGDGAVINFLFPSSKLTGQTSENINNTSVVARLVYGQGEALFMGDLESEAQNALLNSGQKLESDVYKVPHHGSKDSVNQDLVNAVHPKFSVVSVGKDNKFGHPSTDALEELQGSKVFRTDYDGDVRFGITSSGAFAL